MSLAVATHGWVVSSQGIRFHAPRRGRATGDSATLIVPRSRGKRSRAQTRVCFVAASSRSSSSDPSPLDLVAFTVIVDDLVFADGSTRMGVLGGGGPQTAFGFRTHPGDFSCGLAAGVGPDLPRECVDWLDANGIDTEGLALMRVTGTERASPESEEGQSWEGGGADSSAFTCRDAEAETPSGRTFRPTPRAWQITEHDGRRTQVWRTPANAGLYAMLRPPAESLPLKYRAARAFHVGVHPERPDLKLLMDLRNFQKSKKTTERTWISVEPFTRALNPVPRELVERLCSAGDVFSPNELEAVSLVGEGTPLELCERLASAGAKIVCVRRGEKGAVVHDSETRETYSVPTYLQGHDASRIVDVTGCGNAFCGGFIAALVNEESAKRAACWGSAAASVVAEHVGAPATPACASETRKEIEKRFEWLLKRAELLE